MDLKGQGIYLLLGDYRVCVLSTPNFDSNFLDRRAGEKSRDVRRAAACARSEYHAQRDLALVVVVAHDVLLSQEECSRLPPQDDLVLHGVEAQRVVIFVLGAHKKYYEYIFHQFESTFESVVQYLCTFYFY